MPQPRAADTDLLAIELRWPGVETAAALREAAAAIRGADPQAFVAAERPGWLARLFQLDSAYRRARRRHAAAVATLAEVEPRLRDCLARHEAFLLRGEAAAERCRATEQRQEAALAAAEAADGEARVLHELRLGLQVARQDSLTAALLLDRDRTIVRAIRELLATTLPRWHGMIAAALVLRRAARARGLLQALDPGQPGDAAGAALRDIDALIATLGEPR